MQSQSVVVKHGGEYLNGAGIVPSSQNHKKIKDIIGKMAPLRNNIRRSIVKL